MTEETGCTGIGTTAFVAGLVAGIGTGLLFASQSGARTRRQLHNLAKDMQEEANQMLGDAKTSIGKVIAERLKEKGVTKVVFDRGGFLYHGRIRAVADAARAAGLEF